MSEPQREAVYALLRAALGTHAYETARKAMKLNETLAEMTGLPLEFCEFSTGSAFLERRRRISPGAGSSTAITVTSIALW